eukprot:TRINITY_DN20984_c0_g1_i3.p1 TRINITY_DN20984_c0_g1~~TRINITY_DN20984_c0_g1_i3.p1  ORF type:complete len:447 (+),score=50.92 TRINITY_DN20984_c0_g1_i3:136-1476(+)
MCIRDRSKQTGKVATYLNNAAGVVHVFFIESNNLFHMKVGTEGKPLSDPKLLDSAHIIEKMSASGSNDNKRVFLAYQAYRENPSHSCLAPNFKGGCKDVYFTESVDGGENWANPIPIPRNPRDDIAHRFSPQLLFIEEKDRLFIFMRYKNNPSDIEPLFPESSELSYVTRTSGSKIFDNEKLILKDNNVASDISAAYQVEKNKIILKIFFSQLNVVEYVSNLTLMEYTSEDNGLSWTKNSMKLTSGLTQEINTIRYSGALSGYQTQSGYLENVKVGALNYLIWTYSEINGKSIRAKSAITVSEIAITGASRCLQKECNIIFSAMNENSRTPLAYVLKEENFVSLPTPLNKLSFVNGLSIQCYVNSQGEFQYIVIGSGGFHAHDTSGLYFSIHSNNTQTVSYTHLRAHETSLHLVCRLLLEKKKKNTISIQPAHQRLSAHLSPTPQH